MANQEHLDIFNQGVDAWNEWRKKHSDIVPDFTRVDLRGVDLNNANLREANLNNANLRGTDLSEANLTECIIHAISRRHGAHRLCDRREPI